MSAINLGKYSNEEIRVFQQILDKIDSDFKNIYESDLYIEEIMEKNKRKKLMLETRQINHNFVDGKLYTKTNISYEKIKKIDYEYIEKEEIYYHKFVLQFDEGFDVVEVRDIFINDNSRDT